MKKTKYLLIICLFAVKSNGQQFFKDVSHERFHQTK